MRVLDASHIGNPKRGSTETPGAQDSCRVRSTRRAAPAHHSTQYRTLLSRSLINVDVAGGNNAGCSRGTRGAVRSKKIEAFGARTAVARNAFATAKRPYFRRSSSSHSTAGRRMRSDLVNCMPPRRAHLMWKQVPRSSMLRNNKVSPWPRKTVRPLVLLLQAPNDATRST